MEKGKNEETDICRKKPTKKLKWDERKKIEGNEKRGKTVKERKKLKE